MPIVINQLPNELLPFIFKHLDLIDLTKSRLVCKKWMNSIDKNVIIDELIIENRSKSWFGTEKPIGSWFCTGKRIDKKRKINLESWILNWSILIQQLINVQFLRNLKRLKIQKDFTYFDYKTMDISKFEKLEQFEFFVWDTQNQPISICHLNLRILSIVNCKNKFEINCPNLMAFKYWDFSKNLHIHHPNTIKYLDAFEVDKYKKLNLRKYENLEILKINEILILDNKILDQLIKLKKLIIESYYPSEERDLIMITLIKRKQMLKRDLQIFIEYIEVKDIKRFDEIRKCKEVRIDL